VTELDDGSVEVPAVHEPIVQTRFERKPLRARGTKSVTIELQGPNISGTPLASSFSLPIGFHKIPGPA
jgi:hypothetical protein